MANGQSARFDDDLSSLDGLINLRFNSLVPSMNPPQSEDSILTCHITAPHMVVKEHVNEEQGASNPENLPRRPTTPSTNLPLVAPNGAKKPPHTYPELIEYAIERCGPLTVSQIYSWIMSTFPYFQSIGDVRWKPGIRHTLTTHHLFRKIRKDQKLRGWQWSLVPEDERRRNKAAAAANAHWKKQKMQQYEKVLNDKDYNPNAAYLQLQQQIQRQILLRQKLQQQQNLIEIRSKSAEAAAVSSNHPSPSTSNNNQQFAVVNTKEFFQNCAYESDTAVLALQQEHCLALDDEGNQRGEQSSLPAPSGMLHKVPTPSLNLLNDKICEEPLSVDPANFSLLDPALEETPHSNIGLLQIHHPNCEACIPPQLSKIESGASGSPAFGASGSTAFGASGSTSFGASRSTAFGASGSTAFRASGSTAFRPSGSTAFGVSGSTAFRAPGSTYGTHGSTFFAGSGYPGLWGLEREESTLSPPPDVMDFTIHDNVV